MATRPVLPDSYVNFLDGQLPSGPMPSGIFAFIGVGDGSAAVNTVYPVASPNSIKELFGIGPLARDLATFFMEGGGFCYAMSVASVTPGAAGAVTAGQFTAAAVTGTPKNAWSIIARVTVAGALGVAQFIASIDGGRTWGPAQVIKASGNKIISGDGIDVGLTFSTTATSFTVGGADMTVTTTAPKSDSAGLRAGAALCLANAGLVFNAFHFSYEPTDNAASVSFTNDLQADLVAAESTRYKYVYALTQSPALATGALGLAYAQALRAGATANRVQVAGMPAVVKSLGGQFVQSISAVIAARRAQLAPQNSLGLTRAGQLRTIVDFAPGWTIDSVTGMFPFRNLVLVRTIVGLAGFYPTLGCMTDPTSDYKLDSRRLVADLVAADARAVGASFLNMDVDPLDPVKSSSPMLLALQGPADVRVMRKEASRITFNIPSGQDILTSEELIVEIGILPIAHATWIRFNLGFKSPNAEA